MWQGLRVDIGHYHIPKEIMQADPGSNPEPNAHLFEAGPAAIGGLRCLLLIASYNRWCFWSNLFIPIHHLWLFIRSLPPLDLFPMLLQLWRSHNGLSKRMPRWEGSLIQHLPVLWTFGAPVSSNFDMCLLLLLDMLNSSQLKLFLPTSNKLFPIEINPSHFELALPTWNGWVPPPCRLPPAPKMKEWWGLETPWRELVLGSFPWAVCPSNHVKGPRVWNHKMTALFWFEAIAYTSSFL